MTEGLDLDRMRVGLIFAEWIALWSYVQLPKDALVLMRNRLRVGEFAADPERAAVMLDEVCRRLARVYDLDAWPFPADLLEAAPDDASSLDGG